jgi:hypothetical protein
MSEKEGSLATDPRAEPAAAPRIHEAELASGPSGAVLYGAVHYCGQVRDLTPLAGMPLTSLWLNSCPADPAPVRSIQTLKTIGNKPAEEFWREYDARQQGKK